MDLRAIASRVASGTTVSARRKPKRTAKPSRRPDRDSLRPEAEYSVNVEVSLSADFEGSVSKDKLLKKLQSELFAAMKEAVALTARELSLASTAVLVKPLEVGVAVTDLSEDEDGD
jgi:hypothetical protein